MQCPVCLLDLTELIPVFCPKCAWDLKNDLTLNTFLSPIPEPEFDIYRSRVELARQNWEHLQLFKKEQSDKTVRHEIYVGDTQLKANQRIGESFANSLPGIQERIERLHLILKNNLSQSDQALASHLKQIEVANEKIKLLSL